MPIKVDLDLAALRAEIAAMTYEEVAATVLATSVPHSATAHAKRDRATLRTLREQLQATGKLDEVLKGLL